MDYSLHGLLPLDIDLIALFSFKFFFNLVFYYNNLTFSNGGVKVKFLDPISQEDVFAAFVYFYNFLFFIIALRSVKGLFCNSRSFYLAARIGV